MAGRVRVIADAVGDLNDVLRKALPYLQKIDMAKVQTPEGIAAINRVATAVEALNAQLGTTNGHLAQLASTPLLGFLGGGAEAEIQKLVVHVDNVRVALVAGARSVRR